MKKRRQDDLAGCLGGGEGGAGRGGRPAALSVGQLVSLCTAVSLCNWGGGGVSLNQPIVGGWILLSCA